LDEAKSKRAFEHDWRSQPRLDLSNAANAYRDNDDVEKESFCFDACELRSDISSRLLDWMREQQLWDFRQRHDRR
jgi:hypothetical protein